jgi:hypothetical protein
MGEARRDALRTSRFKWPKRPDMASRPPSWGRTRPVTVDSGQKQATATGVSGVGRLHSCSGSSAVEPGEGQMGNVGQD